MSLRYLSICAGIEAASVAWEPLGFQPVLFSEIDPFPRAVLARRQRAIDARRTGSARQGVPLWGDFTALRRRHLRRLGIATPDILVGGTPCQAFSIAGLRRSLEDARGDLTLSFVRLAHAIDPRWVLWENVPGILATRDNAFGCFLAGLVGAGAPLLPPGKRRWPDAGMAAGPRRTAAWRILDAQYFGLAQRRRRVFVVSGRTRDRTNPGAILFEPEGVRRDPPPRRTPGTDLAGTLEARAAQGGFDPGAHGAATGHLQVLVTGVANTLRGEGFDASEDGSGRANLVPVAFGLAMRGRGGGAALEGGGDLAHALRSSQGGGDKPLALIASDMALRVRRLMPVECERLQGFPDGYTDIPWRGRPCSPDGPRYRAIGNSMAVPVMRWIGQRIVKAGGWP